jgi:hypothetical protein
MTNHRGVDGNLGFGAEANAVELGEESAELRAARVNWLSTSTPRSSSRAATNSLATRFIPSCKLLT